MKNIKHFFIIALVIVSTALQAQKQTTPPPAGKPKDFVLPGKKDKELPNGMKGTFVQYGAVPKVNVRLIIKTGSVHEKANQVWLADLTAKLLKEGTAAMNFAAISKKLAAMGGDIDISVSMDQTSISGSVLSEYASDLITIMGDLIMNPLFPSSEIERLKSDLKRQLAVKKAQPRSQAEEKFFKTIYPDHPYSQYFPTEAMVNTYTVDMVKEFYKNNFGAKRSVLYVVGKFEEPEVAAAFEKTFSPWAAGPEVNYPLATPKRTNEIALIDRKGAPQTTILVGLPTLTPKNSDYVALEVTNSLLGGSFGSRITTNIREDKGYTYSPSSIIQNRKGGSVWYERADVTTEHTGASLKEISKEISRLQKENPSKEEMEGIQKYEAGLFVLKNSTLDGIIRQLNFIDLHGLDDSYLTNHIKDIYALTPEKISQMAREHLKYEDMALVMVGDKIAIEKQKKELEESRKLK
jgi:zinc protease